MDIAQLGIEVDSSQVKRADENLDRFARTGKRAQGSADRLTRTTQRMSGAMVSAARAASALAVGVAAAMFGRDSVRQAMDFNAAMAETSTLIKGTDEEMRQMAEASKALAATYGTKATEQVKAFYQAISAGADGVAGATEIVDAANRLALGGVTDVTTAVDGLTTAVNAYAAQGLTAAEASDALFIGMAAGKTTVGELAMRLGAVIPIASAAGVSFDELVAGIAALTTQGQTTGMAATGLRQIIQSVIKPTEQAKVEAERLGLAFNSAALESQGLAGFLRDVLDKSGSSKDSLAQLFGSVEALNAVLAFAGGAGTTFNLILGDMANKAGATDAAVAKMAENLNQRLSVVLSQFGIMALNAGNALLTALVPALEGTVAAIQVLIDNLDILKAVLVGMAATQIPAMITAVGNLGKAMIGLGSVATGVARVIGGAVAIMGGPWAVLAGLVAGAASYFLIFRSNAETTKGSVDDLKLSQEALNQALGQFVQGAPNAGNAAIEAANNYRKMAAAARDAAASQIAQLRAEIAAQEAMNRGFKPGQNVFGRDELDNLREDLKYAMEELNMAQESLRTAQIQSRVTGMRVIAAAEEAVQETANLNRELKTTSEIIVDMPSIPDAIGPSSELDNLVNDLNDGLTLATDKASEMANRVKQAFSALFSDMVRGGKRAQEILRNLAQDLMAMATQKAFFALLGAIAPGIFGQGGFLSLVGSAKGNVFEGGNVVPFAKGGIVDKPTVFPMARGAGLMGEAGPEAIMPLRRGPDGRLGVSGGGTVVQINNYSGEPARAERGRTPDGRELIRVIVGEELARGRFDRQQRMRYGLVPKEVKR